MGSLGDAYRVLGEPQRAIEFFEQALPIMREIGDRSGEGIALGNLGLAYANLEDDVRARSRMQEALVILEAIESPNAATVRRWLAELDR